MAAFEYQAINGKGQTVKGVHESDTLKLARQQLRSQGLTLLELNEVRNKEHKSRSPLLSHSIGIRQMAHITRQLSALLRSGLAIDEALGIIAQQLESSGSKRVLLGIRSRILEGQSLSLIHI